MSSCCYVTYCGMIKIGCQSNTPGGMMRHICSRCKLTSPDGNLWCQEVDCPAGTLPLLFHYGDYLGNLKIVELMRVLRTATLYRAERGSGKELETFILKIAHPSPQSEAYLHEEARILREMTVKDKINGFIPVWHPHGAVNAEDAHGEVVFRDQLRHYMLMEYVEGEFLADTLLDNPQPWHRYAAWFTISLCKAVIAVQKSAQALHLNLNPDVIMVRRNKAGVPQPVLLDMGLLKKPHHLPASEAQQMQHFLLPAYTPPEMIVGGELSARIDVYGIGLLLHEMLAGQPAYPYTLRQTEDIFTDIRLVSPVLERPDLPGGLGEINGHNGSENGRNRRHKEALLDVVRRAVRQDHPKRYQDVTELLNALLAIYGEPEDKREINTAWLTQRLGAVIAVGAVVIFLLFVLMVFVTAIISPVVA